MDQLVQFLQIAYAVIHGVIILKATVIFSDRLTAGDTLWTQILNIFHGKERIGIKNMSLLATAVTDNTYCGLLKSPRFQRVQVIPEGGQAKLGLPFLLFLLFLQCFGIGEGIMVAPVFRIVLQDAQPLELVFKRMEITDTVRISICLSKLFLKFNISLQVFAHSHTSINPTKSTRQ